MSSKKKTTDTKEDAKPVLVPKLRFPEFRGAELWKDLPIASILKVRDERRVPTTEAPLFSLTIESGITEKTDRYNREFLVRDAGNKKYKLVEPNDIVYNPSNLRWGAINYSQLSHSVVVSPIYEVLSLGDKSEHCLEFIACAVMRNEQIRRFITKAQGTLVERIAVKIEDFLSTKLLVPPTRAEQQKIAACLSSLDEVIAAQARKVDALKTHKKGLMQQLFPREGETQPRLRFPEFNDEWNDATLGELSFSVSSGKDARESDGPFDLYGSTGIIGKTATASYDTPHILVARVGANAGHLTKASGQFGVTDNTLVIRLKQAASIDFVFHFLGNININKLIFGSGQPLITGSILKAQRVLIPAMAEQSKISTCLSSIDDLINAESDKLEALKAHKNGLMQQLFPSAEAVKG